MTTRSLRALVVLLALGLAPPAHGSEPRLVLERLQRIARGQWLPAAPPPTRVPYAAEIRAAAGRHGLAAPLLAAVVRAESAFDPRAVSHVGALGLAQLMPATARELDVVDPFDPVQNLDGAARYLAAQVASFPSVRLALVAYHAGPERASSGSWPASTSRYVSRVLRFEREYRRHGLP
ncbi:MAG: lytic transglycosylase domain-containing protein [Myxococcota bacterium]